MAVKRSIGARAVQRLSLTADRIRPPAAGVSMLIYHRVGAATTSSIDLSLSEFRAQLARLREQHRVITLDEAIRGLSREDHSVDGSVVLTFDDGTDDFVDVVVPELVEQHLPATLYLATQFVDDQRKFPWGTAPLTWSGLRQAVSTGLVTVGSHTHSHLLLDRVSVAQATADVDRSIDLIGSELGAAPIHFAYPKALPGTPGIQEVIAARFRSAALARSRINQVGQTNLHRLWRTPMQSGESLDLFSHKASYGLRLEGSVREMVSRRRTRGATN